MAAPRDIAPMLDETGASFMTVSIPGGDRGGWRVNLRRQDEGWTCGPEAPSFEEALAGAIEAFKPWSQRQVPDQGDDFEDLLGDLLG